MFAVDGLRERGCVDNPAWCSSVTLLFISQTCWLGFALGSTLRWRPSCSSSSLTLGRISHAWMALWLQDAA